MKISVVIPTRNNGARLGGVLQKLFRQTVSADKYEIIVVDNGSTDCTQEVVRKSMTEAANVRCVEEPQAGRAYARNKGICESRGKVILFLDDDIEVEANHLESHLILHAESTDPIAVIGKVIDISPISPGWAQDYFLKRQVAASRIANRERSGIPLGLYFATGNVSLLRSTLEKIKSGGDGKVVYFDPTFRVREDGDMGCRLIKSGVRFVFADEIICRHNHPRSWRLICDRSYESGYVLARLIEKHPETRVIIRKGITASFIKNWGLGVVCGGLFGPAFLVRFVWPSLLRKVVGGLLAYQINRGFQQALSDYRKRHVSI